VGERHRQSGREGRGGGEEPRTGRAAERIDGVAACGGEVRGALSGASGNACDAEVCRGAVQSRVLPAKLGEHACVRREYVIERVNHEFDVNGFITVFGYECWI